MRKPLSVASMLGYQSKETLANKTIVVAKSSPLFIRRHSRNAYQCAAGAVSAQEWAFTNSSSTIPILVDQS